MLNDRAGFHVRPEDAYEAIAAAAGGAVAEGAGGADFIRVHALPHERLQQILRRYNQLDAAHRPTPRPPSRRDPPSRATPVSAATQTSLSRNHSRPRP